jgi:predicted nucleic acid-binding protein
MIAITDSNIIFSALINPKGKVGQVFREKSNLQFIAPRYIIEEIENHFDKILLYSNIEKQDLKKELNFILSIIKIVETHEIPKKYIFEAVQIVSDIDIYDVFFVALNRYKKHKIWTSDKKLINGLKNKGFDICITTDQIRLKLYKK